MVHHHDDATYAYLADKDEIVGLAIRYATALDTQDWALLGTCFVQEGRTEYSGLEPARGIEEIRARVEQAVRGIRTQHFLSNFVVTTSGDVGTSSCYMQAQHVRADLPAADSTLMIAGIYRDEVERTPEGWRYSRRTLEITWTSGNPEVPLGDVARAD
jgi:hypothetical protein